jgi:TolB-like protein
LRYILVLIFLVSSLPLFAKGKTDETGEKTQNDEWFLCVTKFDSSSLPADKTNISDVISRELVDRLSSISYRTRISPEYAYYEEYAWARSRAAAAKNLSSKMEERSKLIYQGEANWKYRQNIKKIDVDIKKIRDNLDEIDKNAPLINKEPAFKLISGNITLSFPEPPANEGERRFCVAQKADAFLSGQITDFYGRYSLTLKLYVLYTRSFVWEENYIFSYNDISATIDEITRKLMIILSGNTPSLIAVKTEPETTLVLINQSFAGRGEIPSMEYPPGKITINASAPDHDSIVLETELVSGELTQIDIKLNPIKYVNTDISSKTNGHVYHGSLYVGESPLTLRLPANNLEYVEITQDSGKKGSAVFKTKDNIDYNQTISFKLSQPNKRGAVDRQRKDYYWAWGGQWITGIAAWLGYYTCMGVNEAINTNKGNVPPEFDTHRNNMFNLYYGAAIAFGVTSLYGIVRMITYIYISGRDSTPIVNTGRSK